MSVWPTYFVNLSYFWSSSFDFLRLNYMLSLTTSLIIPLQYKKYVNTFRVWPCIFSKIIKLIEPNSFLHNNGDINININNKNNEKNAKSLNWIEFNKSSIIDISDIDSLYNWLSIRHYFLEFGLGFRKRELGIIGCGIASYCLLVLPVLYRLFILGDDIDGLNYVIILFGLTTYLIPTFVTIAIASKIQRNFKKEIQLLKDRKIEENLRYCHEMRARSSLYKHDDGHDFKFHQEKQDLSNAVTICHKISHFYSNKVGFDTIISTLEHDFQEYSFRIFGLRVDQGIVNLIYPIVISLVSIFARTMF